MKGSQQHQVSFLVIVALVAALYLFWQYSQLTAITLAIGTVADDAALPPISVDTATATSPNGTTTMLFLGDIMLGRNVEFLAGLHGDTYPFRYTTEFVSSYDFVIANFESAAAIRHERTKSGGFRFSTTPALITALGEYGVTHASLANNHALDYGSEGYANVKELLLGAKITPFGHPTTVSSTSVAYLQLKDGRAIAIIGIHTLFNEPSSESLRAVLDDASQNSVAQIAYVHWGNEYESVHSRAQERFARTLIALGTDVVIGHHPHVAQDIQVINGVPVFYSLGNYIFDQYFSRDVQEGYGVGITIHRDALYFDLIPITSRDSRSAPRLMDTDEKTEFLTLLAGRSDISRVEQILMGRLIFDTMLASSSQNSMMTP
jgi:poly-gamma-glutamate synthesis protein (capsule biosynthesis protein)